LKTSKKGLCGGTCLKNRAEVIASEVMCELVLIGPTDKISQVDCGSLPLGPQDIIGLAPTFKKAFQQFK